MKIKKTAIKAVIGAAIIVVGLVTGINVPAPARAALVEGGAALVELVGDIGDASE